MRHVVSVESMRQADARTIENGVPGVELMRRAAEGIYRAANWSGSTVIVAGTGNNAGDGYALAGFLARGGYAVEIFRVGEKASPDGQHFLEEALSIGVPVHAFDATEGNGGVGVTSALDNFDNVVDCLLGTGFKGTPREDVAAAIDAINAFGELPGKQVVSADINSGLDGESGTAQVAAKSDLTVSIGHLKNGMFLNDAARFIGRLVNVEIGIDAPEGENALLAGDEFKSLLEERKGYVMQYPEYDVATENFGMIDDLELSTPVEAARKLASALHVNVLVKGASTDYLTAGGSVSFLAPGYVDL